MPAASASSPAVCMTRAWARFACSECTTRGCCDRGRRGRAALVRAPLQPRGRLSRGDGGGVGVAAARAPACGGGTRGHRLAAVPGRARRRPPQPRAHPAGGARARARRARGRGFPPLRHLLRRPDPDPSPRRPRRAGDVLLPFFGAPAPFPLGPFVLARAAGAPVVPAFCLLDADHRYRIVVGAPFPVDAGAETAALGRWVSVLEGMVRRHPAQWFNFFDLWSPSA